MKIFLYFYLSYSINLIAMTSSGCLKSTKQICRNCKSENIDKYCSECGQRVYSKRFTVKSFFYIILGSLNIERGFFHTLIMLFTDPGKVINHYLHGKTKSYYNPLKYLIIIAGIYAFLMIGLKILDANYEEMYRQISKNNEALQADEDIIQMQKKVFDIFRKFINFLPFLLIPFTSIISKWFYSSKKLFYGEHLVINCFIFSQIFILYILWSPIVATIPSLITYFPYITLVSSIIYLSFALNKTFHESLIRSILGSFLIYLLGFILFMVFIIVIGSIAILLSNF